MSDLLNVRRVKQAIVNVAARHGIAPDKPRSVDTYSVASIWGCTRTTPDMDAEIAEEYDRLAAIDDEAKGMSEPTTAEGRALLDTVRHSIYDAEMRAAILAIEAAAAEAEREAERARIRAAVRDPLIELSLFIADNSYGEDRAELESYLRLVLAAIDAPGTAPADPSTATRLLWQDDCLCWHKCSEPLATPDRADDGSVTFSAEEFAALKEIVANAMVIRARDRDATPDRAAIDGPASDEPGPDGEKG